MSNVYTKNLSDEIYFLNDKNIVLEIDVNGVINPIASHLLVKNISDDISVYIDETNNNFESISNVIFDLLSTDKKIIADILLSANELSTYSDSLLYSISSLIDKKIENISSSVAIAYRPMGTVDNYGVLEYKLNLYLSLSDELPMSSHIGEVWNVTSSLTPEGIIEKNNNFVLVTNSSTSSGYSWDDIGGITDLSRYALSVDVDKHVSNEIEKLTIYVNLVSNSVTTSLTSNINSVSTILTRDIHSNTDLITNTKTEILSTVTDINTKLTSADTFISGKIDNILTSSIPTIEQNVSDVNDIVLEIKNTSIPNINENISNISTDVSTLSTNVNIALEQVLKTVEFAGHVTFSSLDDAKATASTLSDLINKFNIPEKSRIKNGEMYHVEFTLTSDNIPADELALYYVDVKIAENSYVRISHGDYIIFHDHETKQFIDISSITKENIYVTEVSFSDLYSLSTTVSAKIEDLSNTVSRDYAYLSGNNISNDHILSGRHDFNDTINVTNLSATKLSANYLSANDLYATNLSATSLSAKTLTAEQLSVTNKLSATEIITPSANLSTANISVANVSGNLSVNFGNVYDTSKNGQTLSAQINTLSASIDNKIHIGDATEVISSDLIVRKLTNEEYAEKLNNDEILSNTIYIIEDEYIDAYGQVISNATNSNIQEILTSYAHVSAISSNFNGPSEAATVKLVSALTIGKVGALSDSLSTTIGTLNNSLISAISSKIYIQDPTVPELSDGKYNVDLSVIKLAPDDYIEKLTKDEIKDTALYVLCSDYVDAFGQVISNAVNTSATYENGLSGFIEELLLETVSKSLAAKESEAATVEYVNAIVNARITNSYNRIYNALNEI